MVLPFHIRVHTISFVLVIKKTIMNEISWPSLDPNEHIMISFCNHAGIFDSVHLNQSRKLESPSPSITIWPYLTLTNKY